MRIISGTFKGRRFQLPKGLMARPTTDFAKEGLFNILMNQINFEGLKMLDLFAGTGSIGFEFFSRGAITVTCVEQTPLHVHFIRSVIEKLEATGMRVIQGDVFTYIKTNQGEYDVIFSDAPYAEARLVNLPDLIFASNLLSKEGLFIMEHPKKINFTSHPNFTQTRNYGNVHFSFFRHLD
jgi:16S rRNA (guanine966-N2)-methyltransferase